MLDQILSLVKEYGQQSVVENNEVPNEYNNEVMAATASTITGGFQNMISGGGLQNIVSLFTGGNDNGQQQKTSLLSNPLVIMMIGHLASKLMNSTKMNSATANNVASNIIPSVISGLIAKTASNAPENDGFDLNDLIAGFTGGNAAANNTQTNGFDFQGLLNQFTGGGQNSSSNIDISSIINQVTQGAQQHQQQQQQSGGIADLISGFFK